MVAIVGPGLAGVRAVARFPAGGKETHHSHLAFSSSIYCATVRLRAQLAEPANYIAFFERASAYYAAAR
jgi:hypothetical protein